MCVTRKTTQSEGLPAVVGVGRCPAVVGEVKTPEPWWGTPPEVSRLCLHRPLSLPAPR